eukprot:Transcript_10223.p1 GENE.Transcript_10223~~Transcript_10223.p1  ORF type:complete len:394 (-),score=113.99 Transcript_10223:15-1151(-)
MLATAPLAVAAAGASPLVPQGLAAGPGGTWGRTRTPLVALGASEKLSKRLDAEGYEMTPVSPQRLAYHVGLNAKVSFYRLDPDSPCFRGHMGSKPWVVAHVERDNDEFDLAVYESHDIAKDPLRASTGWGRSGFREIEKALDVLNAQALIDVGANLGWYSFAFATRGRKALMIEPFGPNVDLLNTSFCLNPARERYIGLMPIGLDNSSRRCDLYQLADGPTYGDAQAVCDRKNADVDPSLTKQGEMETFLLDDVIPEEFRSTSKVVRLDLGGHELAAIKGMSTLLQDELQRPLLIQSTFSAANPNPVEPDAYLRFMHGLGYDPHPASRQIAPGQFSKRAPTLAMLVTNGTAATDVIFERPALRDFYGRMMMSRLMSKQ